MTSPSLYKTTTIAKYIQRRAV